MILGACQAHGPGISAGPGRLLSWPRGLLGLGLGLGSVERVLLQCSDLPRIKRSDYEGDCVVPAKLATPLIILECPGALEMAVQDGN